MLQPRARHTGRNPLGVNFEPHSGGQRSAGHFVRDLKTFSCPGRGRSSLRSRGTGLRTLRRSRRPKLGATAMVRTLEQKAWLSFCLPYLQF